MTYGKAIVHWNYLGSMSEWGRLKGAPVTILMFEFVFQQPDGFELEQADFHMTFNNVDKKHVSPQVKAWAPSDFLAAEHSEAKTSRFQAIPQAPGGGIEVGGVGIDRSKTTTLKRRCWALQSIRQRDMRRATGELTKVTWTYSACKLAPGEHRPVTTRVGLVIDFLLTDPSNSTRCEYLLHDTSVDVEISGRLRSARKRLRFVFGGPGVPRVNVPINKCSDRGDLYESYKAFEIDIRKANLVGRVSSPETAPV